MWYCYKIFHDKNITNPIPLSFSPEMNLVSNKSKMLLSFPDKVIITAAFDQV